jgi:hypothetical protein
LHDFFSNGDFLVRLYILSSRKAKQRTACWHIDMP